VCQSVSSKLLFEQRFDPPSGIDFLNGYTVVICTDCGMGFADNIPDQSVFDRYYRDLSKYEHHTTKGAVSSADQARYRDIASTIESAIPEKKSRILEVGCATGGLLAELRHLGFHNVHGLDPSPACARSAWDVYGIPVFAASLFNMPSAEYSYEFLIAGGVLEHIEDVRQALACLRRAVEPHGKVYVEVPDASRLACRPDAPFQEFSTEHINFFSGASLRNLFGRNGFATVTIGHADRWRDHSAICPTVFGVFTVSDRGPEPLSRDEETEAGLIRYISASRSVDALIREKINSRARNQTIIIWGTGAHTQRLLAVGAFENIQITAFVDSNPKYQGRLLNGIPVLSPEEVRLHAEPILISSRGFEREIRDVIRHKLKLPNDVILLYEDKDESFLCTQQRPRSRR
jgi:SAM-dependent methyltransferase